MPWRYLSTLPIYLGTVTKLHSTQVLPLPLLLQLKIPRFVSLSSVCFALYIPLAYLLTYLDLYVLAYLLTCLYYIGQGIRGNRFLLDRICKKRKEKIRLEQSDRLAYVGSY